MFGPDLTVTVDVWFSLAAMQDLPLAHGKEFIAVSALVEIVIFFFQEKFEFLHEKSTN